MKPYEDNFNCAYTKCNLECVTLQCGPFTSNATPCSNCEFANCCSELAQCSVGTDCYSLYTCSNACPSNDASCQQACSTQFPGGLAGYGAILKCSDSKCGKECNGGQCGSFPSGDATCDACMETSCCSQQLACDTGSACSSFAACAKACSDGDQACYGSCRAQFPTGIDPYAINVACSHIHCSTQCKPLAIDAVCSTGISTGKQSCDVCLTANCCSEFKACSGELDPTSGLPKDSARWDACVSCIFKGMPPSDSQFTCESLMSPAATTCLNTHCSQDCM